MDNQGGKERRRFRSQWLMRRGELLDRETATSSPRAERRDVATRSDALIEKVSSYRRLFLPECQMGLLCRQ